MAWWIIGALLFGCACGLFLGGSLAAGARADELSAAYFAGRNEGREDATTGERPEPGTPAPESREDDDLPEREEVGM